MCFKSKYKKKSFYFIVDSSVATYIIVTQISPWAKILQRYNVKFRFALDVVAFRKQ